MGEGLLRGMLPRWMHALVCILLLLLPALSNAATTGDSSRVELPSEEELRLALDVGDITYDQYLVLMDIVVHGLDSANILQLQDMLIPEWLLSLDSVSVSEVTTVEKKAKRTVTSTSLRHRYYLEYDEPCCTWYRSYLNVNISEFAQCRADFAREKSGRERVTGRSIHFTPESSWVQDMTWGTFSARYGQGAVIGYRGKLLDMADELGEESWLYPDYGGYNGVQAVLGAGSNEARFMMSQQRDDEHRLSVVAGTWRMTYGRWIYGAVVSAARLGDRLTDQRVTLPMYSVFVEHRYKSGRLAAEAGVQHGPGYQAPVGVIEGSYRKDDLNVQFAGWAYGDKLIELTSGSRAASMSRSTDVDDVDFTYSARRPGQEGVRLKTSVALSDNWRLMSSALYAGYDRRYRNLDFESEVERKLTSVSSVAFVFQARKRERVSTVDTDRLRWRLESRLHTGIVRARAYIAVTSESDEERCWSLFGSTRIKLGRENEVEMQVNLARFSDDRLEDTYGYIRGQQKLPLGLTGGMKVAQRYSRNGSDPYQTVITLEVAAQL